jgi:hypothetical protein
MKDSTYSVINIDDSYGARNKIRLEALMEVTVKITVFQVMTLCSYQSFGEIIASILRVEVPSYNTN